MDERTERARVDANTDRERYEFRAAGKVLTVWYDDQPCAEEGWAYRLNDTLGATLNAGAGETETAGPNYLDEGALDTTDRDDVAGAIAEAHRVVGWE